MSEKTNIEWCDSSLNPAMGCNGCELWNRDKGIQLCYAGTMTDRYGGANAGFPKFFEHPELFVQRFDQGFKWKDLTGTKRPLKPWLDDLPRTIFIGDMGDIFTESLPDPEEWLAPWMPKIADSKHIFLFLTKRPSRMVNFSKKFPFPPNIWPGTTVTSNKTLRRAEKLLEVRGGGPKWISAEPLLEHVSFRHVLSIGHSQGNGPIQMLIVGGMSQNPSAPQLNLDGARINRDECAAAGVAFFMKQVDKVLPIPDDLMIRQMPKVK